ncbi:MAG: patatin-like phospholipase family protein, partial [Flavobacteriales bacterium]|nr:patatin-like phospholipase family protein [Flavobacteriales bacterium]
GSSMGASVGGIYCAGKLDAFKDWVLKLNKRETFRLMDFTMSTQGVLKGQKVLDHLKTILGEIRIEDFDIPYTAVATDVNTKEEIWMRHGDLYSVIRASSSIPTLMMPAKLGDRLLIDGAVLNPLPIEPMMPKKTDIIVAVNINGNPEKYTRYREIKLGEGQNKLNETTAEEAKAYSTRMVNTVKSWLSMSRSVKTDRNQESTLSYFGMLNKTFDFMQDRMCEQSIDLYKPDIVVNIPRHLGTTLEFYRAKEMIQEGRTACQKAIVKWKEKSEQG